MKHRIVITAIATTTALGGACAFLVPAASASAAVKSHTIRFTSVVEATHNFSQTSNSQQDKDVNGSGKVIGYDLLYSVFNPKTETGKLAFTAVLNGGFVYGVATASSNPESHGTITGGTGAFKGARGTLLAKNLNKAGTKTAITITYHT
jgi:hypothetical protein